MGMKTKKGEGSVLLMLAWICFLLIWLLVGGEGDAVGRVGVLSMTGNIQVYSLVAYACS